MHDRDLPRGTAEADPAELPPVAKRLGARRCRGRRRPASIRRLRSRRPAYRRPNSFRPRSQERSRRAGRMQFAGLHISPSSSCTSTSSPAATLPVSLPQHDEAIGLRHRRQDARALIAGRAHGPAARRRRGARMPRWNSVRPGTFLIGADSGTLNVGSGATSRWPCSVKQRVAHELVERHHHRHRDCPATRRNARRRSCRRRAAGRASSRFSRTGLRRACRAAA